MSADLRPGPDSPPTDEQTCAEATLGVLQHVVHRISRDGLSKRTPCSEYDVAQLTDHLLTSITALGGAARTALDAWRRRGLDGTVKIDARELPAALAATFCASNSWCTPGTTRQRPAITSTSPIR